MAAGVDRVMTMDLHADQIQGFFDIPVDALYASGIFVPYIESLHIEDLSIAAPDMGGAKRANTYAKHLGTPIIISHKERAKANVVGKMTAIGEVEGRNVLIVDDMIDTAGTICMAADMLMARGAKSVRAAITHPVLSGPAYERINDSALEEVIAAPGSGAAAFHLKGRQPSVGLAVRGAFEIFVARFAVTHLDNQFRGGEGTDRRTDGLTVGGHIDSVALNAPRATVSRCARRPLHICSVGVENHIVTGHLGRAVVPLVGLFTLLLFIAGEGGGLPAAVNQRYVADLVVVARRKAPYAGHGNARTEHAPPERTHPIVQMFHNVMLDCWVKWICKTGNGPSVTRRAMQQRDMHAAGLRPGMQRLT